MQHRFGVPVKMLSFFTKPRPYIHLVIGRSFSDVVAVAETDGIRKITMIDDKTRNSMTINMTQNLLRAVTDQVDSPELRAVVITSAGRMFSSGHNLKDLASSDGRKVFGLYSDLMMAMQACPVPVITCVDGAAVAAGAQLVAQSDIAIASDESTFATPGANFGVFCHTPGIPIARSTHRKTAAYMLFTGISITAQEAVERGLVSKVVRKDELELELTAVCDAIKSKSKAVISLGKAFFYKQLELETRTAYKEGAKVMSDSLDLADGIEGLKSFSEKRKPIWKHK